jgi:alginate production protein
MMAGIGLRGAAARVVRPTALAVALAGMPAVVAEAKIDRREAVPIGALPIRDLGRGETATLALQTATATTSPRETGAVESARTRDSDAPLAPNRDDSPPELILERRRPGGPEPNVQPWFRYAPAATDLDRSSEEHAVHEVIQRPLAQFQLPPKAPPKEAPPEEPTAPRGLGPPIPLTTFLTYQYGYGSESSIVYRRDRDLNKRLRDNSNIITPQVNGVLIYRPTDWLETTLEVVLDKELEGQEEDLVTLPSGEVEAGPRKRASLAIDQAFVTLKRVIAPFEFHVGRRNYEDERHWLYDTSMDTVSASLRAGYFRAEATVGREVWEDMDLFKPEVEDRINTSMLYAEYRGIEDLKLAGYAITRHDLDLKERPRWLGVRALGTPSDRFNYWAELAYLRGGDATSRKFSGRGLDVGGTYRFTDLPFYPSVSLSYAFGSGDANPDDRKNYEFRQTGLQSDEARLAGIPKFKYYGEVLDPELSNLKIITLGFGFRPVPSVSVELVYHRYRLDKIADQIRNWALTAEMNQVDTQLSTHVGSALDVVFGFRNLFGLRRLGMDVRVGWFFPGKAFLRNDGDDQNPIIRGADEGFTIVTKFWW